MRAASSAFCDSAEHEGWVEAPRDLGQIANVLLNGASPDGAPASGDYAAMIGAAENPASDVYARIQADATAARVSLASVTDLAERFLDGEDVSSAARADVVSYERALVNAQKARRAFIKAAEIAEGETPDATASALAGFEAEIDRARRAADLLADRYAARPRAGA
ncbi:MAG: hypothetical protein AAFX03_00630 [Pseudomonadota bacterium]